jgi:hypothetical protein
VQRGDCGDEGFRTSVVAGFDAAPLPQPAEHDLDAVAAPVVEDGLSAWPAGDAGAYLFVSQCIPERAGTVTPFGDKPFSGG